MKHIAIVDDDVYIGDMLQEVLERAGYAVSRAYSGSEAVLLAQSGRRPDLMLLDLMLPGLSGREALPELRGIPVIVLSARGAVEDKVQLLLEGAADYVTKPFDTRELLARVAVQLRQPGERRLPPAVVSGYLPRHRLAYRVCRGRRGAPHPDGVRHSAPSHGEPGAGGHPLPPAGGREPGHPRLRGELAEGPHEQPAPEAAPGGAGDCIQAVWGIGFRLCGES